MIRCTRSSKPQVLFGRATSLFAAMMLIMNLTAVADQPLLVYKVTPTTTEVDFEGKLAVEASLTNRGGDPVTVYWGDYAYPDMYRFEIVHVPSGKRILNTRDPVWFQHVPALASERNFKTIEPGATIRYMIVLSALHGANSQLVYFRRPGNCLIKPTLHVSTNRMLDDDSSNLLDRADAWTGTLAAKPFTITVRAPGPAVNDGSTISGTVVRGDGRPAAGAVVQLYQVAGSFGSLKGMLEKKVDQAYADDEGRYQFDRISKDCFSYRVVAWTPDWPAGGITVKNDDLAKLDAVDVEIPKGVTLLGRVVDQQGQPLADVRVSSLTRTDQDGRFAAVMPAGNDEFNVDLWRRGFVGISAKTDKQTATNGDWQIEMYMEESVRVRGRATFVDGKPIKDGRLKFELHLTSKGDVPNRHWTEVRCETDQQGRFQITLPAPAVYKALVTAQEDDRLANRRQWTTSVDALSPASSPLNLVFQNRGNITVQIGYTKPLPAELTLVVDCSFAQGRLVSQQKVTPNTDAISFKGLAPGDYSVSVWLEQASQRRWSRDLTIPNEEPFSASAKITLPELAFGGIKGRLLMPDGKTPAAHLRLSLHSAAGARSMRTDDQGVFRAVDLLAGPISITPGDDEPNIAQVPITGRTIEGGRITYLGNVRLKRTDEEFGWLEGVLQRDDGQPIRDADIIGYYAGLDGAIRMVPSGFQVATTDQQGAFRIRVRKGKQKLLFQLSGGAPSGGFVVGEYGIESRRLIVDVEIQPGETTHRRLVLQQRPGRDEVTVRWNQEDLRPHIVGVAVQDSFRWTSALLAVGDTHTFKQVPAGAFQLMIRDLEKPFFAVQSVPAEDFANGIEINSASTELLVTATDSQHRAIKDLGITITAQLGNEAAYVCRVPPKADDHDNKIARNNKMFQQLADGSMRIIGLAPGAYRVEITNGSWKHAIDVALPPAGTALRVQINPER